MPRRHLAPLARRCLPDYLAIIDGRSAVIDRERRERDEGVSLVRLRAVLAALLPELRRRHRVRSVAVFGSVARGEAGPESDIDLLVTFEPGASLFDLIELEEALAARFGRRVEVVTPGSLHPEIAERVRREAVTV